MLTTEQAEARRHGIGGSDVAAIAGLSPWRTPLDVFLDKTEGADMEETPAMYWGSVLEDTVASEYAKATGNKIRHVNRVLEHPDHPFIRASLDRQIVSHPDGPGVLEIKTAGRLSDAWGEPGTDQVPDYYHLQVDQYLMVTGYRWAHLAALFLAEREFRIYRIEVDPEISEWLMELETRFWKDHVEAGIPPEPQSLADIAKRYPRDDGSRVVALLEQITYCEQLREVRGELKRLTDRKDELEGEIKKALGEASELVDIDGMPLATWKTQKRNLLDQKALRAAHPELTTQFTHVAESRMFRLK